MKPRTLFEKIWDIHVVDRLDNGSCLLYIDRHLVHEVTSPQAFEGLRLADRPVRHPSKTLAVADHAVPTSANRVHSPKQAFGNDQDSLIQVATLGANTERNGIPYFSLSSPEQGIVHIVGPEQGWAQPGITLVCGDSHTSTQGAFGALAFGIGTSEVEHVLATQTLWQKPAQTMQILVEGIRPLGTTAKDLILAIIGQLGTAGGTGYVIEYAGEAIQSLSMEERMTVCNMSIEAGARAGMIAPDQRTFDYLKRTPKAPKGELWDVALAYWQTLPSDPDARYDRQVRLDAAQIVPQVTWGTSPQDVLPITDKVPDPATMTDPARRQAAHRALEYMGLEAGTPLQSIVIDKVFIGSCTNSRIEDLREVAKLVKNRKIAPNVHAMVVPGSGLVKRQAEQEGLDRVLVEAGFEWREAGCSMCLGMNSDRLQPQQRCASTSNRNFEGRQGRGGRTHLMSPAMAAAAALTGHLSDIRELLS